MTFVQSGLYERVRQSLRLSFNNFWESLLECARDRGVQLRASGLRSPE
jgi:hypothetical protein